MLYNLPSADSCDINKQKSYVQVEFEIGLGSILNSTSQPSSKVKGKVALSMAPVLPHYYIAKNRTKKDIRPP